MDLWLLRHAAAEDRARSGRDSDRALTDEGRLQARSAAEALRRLDPEVDQVWTSPYRRARETAAAAAAVLELEEKLRETATLEPSADPEHVLEELRGRGARGAVLVGHQPHLGLLLGRLLTGGKERELPLKKAGIAWLRWDGGDTAELRALIPPRVRERLGG
ncbi:MAG: phosphohistidine phosphatase SixA [Thermoanaerobaculia bacterium]